MLRAFALRRLLAAILFAAVIGGACHVHADITAYEQLWFGTSTCDTPSGLSLALHHPETAPPSEMTRLVVEINALIPYEATRVMLSVENALHAAEHQAEIVANLQRGLNEFSFNWSGNLLSPGDYRIVVTVDYADNVSPARCVLPFSKVSAAHWAQELARADAALARLSEQLAVLEGSGRHAPYIWLRLRVAEDARDAASAAIRAHAWERVDRNLAYIQDTLSSLDAGLAFSKSTPELFAPHDHPSLADIEIRDGGFYAAGRPVFLYGVGFEAGHTTPEMPYERLLRYGLNFGVCAVPLGVGEAGIETTVETALRAASDAGIALAVQFAQDDVVGNVMDEWPELLEPGFVNMAHEQYRNIYMARVSRLAAALRGKPYVVGASIAHDPMFKYEGEPVRLRFIERVAYRYPDRIDLNRLWRSHLADYDEITIWGEHPDYSYQNQRAYQYEWQSFHRELITHFFADVKQELARTAPDVPVMLTLPDTAFSAGETRYSPNREQMAAMMDINSSTATAYAGETLYAMSYPSPHAYYTLLRSYTPHKPVLNLAADIDLRDVVSADMRYALVRSTVWESALCGVNGLALLPDTELFDYPEAIEAFASAAMDVNRLGRIVRAFQQAPASIGILFSEASKIMDDGIPHLDSARYAFEGSSFAGFAVRFLTEAQIEAGGLHNIKVLVLPETLAVSDETFEQISRYVEVGGMVARVGTPIPYNERGHSRGDVIRATSNTVLVRGMNLPTEYLHAMDAALVEGVLPQTARPVNAFGYPLEGVRSRYIELDDEHYLYIINLRQRPVNCYLTGVVNSGRDLIHGRNMAFPRLLPPLEPMLIRMDRREAEITVAAEG